MYMYLFWRVYYVCIYYTVYVHCIRFMFDCTFHARPQSSTLGKAQDTEIFRNMDHFERVTTCVPVL
jgi:hypothetical protein